MKLENWHDEQLRQQIRQSTEYISRQVLGLRAEYLSDVAPDRKQLYEQAKNTIKKQTGNSKCKGCGELSLLDFLEKAEGKSSNFAEKTVCTGGRRNIELSNSNYWWLWC